MSVPACCSNDETGLMANATFGRLGYDDDSLIARDPVGSWRYYVQSFPVRRPPRPLAVCRQPAATPPAPAWPFPRSQVKRKERVRCNDRKLASRPKEKKKVLCFRHLLLLLFRSLLVFQILVLPSAHVCVRSSELLDRVPIFGWLTEEWPTGWRASLRCASDSGCGTSLRITAISPRGSRVHPRPASPTRRPSR